MERYVHSPLHGLKFVKIAKNREITSFLSGLKSLKVVKIAMTASIAKLPRKFLCVCAKATLCGFQLENLQGTLFT